MEQITFEQLPEAISRVLFRLDNIERLIRQADPHEPNNDLLTAQEAAEFLDLSLPTIYTKTSRGELPFMKRAKRIYFSKQELTAFLKSGRKRANSEIIANPDEYLKPLKRRRV